DRNPVENDADRDVRNLEVFGPWRRRRRARRPGHVDFGKAERSDMQPTDEQSGSRDVAAEIVNGEIGAVAVADIDPVDFHPERYDSAQSRYRDGEIRIA